MIMVSEHLDQEINTALEEWRQGDYVLSDVLSKQYFFHLCDPRKPLTEASEAITDDTEIAVAVSEVKGLVVVTQTCDIGRFCSDRPYVEVVPLMVPPVIVKDPVSKKLRILKADDNDPEYTNGLKEKLLLIKKARYPQYAFVPGAFGSNLVANLDCVMTVEKAVFAGWNRERGCTNDEEIRALGLALARKRIRFAFPDEFNDIVVKKLQDEIKKRHGKKSPEGAALLALREIRVRAEPSWQDSKVELMFWFIREDTNVMSQRQWSTHCDKWLKLILPYKQFSTIHGEVTTLADMTAQDYIESDPLDLDHLSG
jgi:hypothetical protein